MQPEESSSASVVDGSRRRRAPGEDTPPRRRRRGLWITLWILGVLLVLVIAAGAVAAVFASEAMAARDALNKAKYELSTMSSQLSTGDQAAVERTAQTITDEVADAAAIVDGPLWHVAALVPFVGQNVDAVQRVTRAVDILIEQALSPGMQFMAVADLDQLMVEGGGIDLEPFRQVQDSVPVISDAFQAAQAEIAPIDEAELLPYVAEPIDEILTIINGAAPALDVVSRYLPTLLDIAGSGGSKTYLVIFQNTAPSPPTITA